MYVSRERVRSGKNCRPWAVNETINYLTEFEGSSSRGFTSTRPCSTVGQFWARGRQPFLPMHSPLSPPSPGGAETPVMSSWQRRAYWMAAKTFLPAFATSGGDKDRIGMKDQDQECVRVSAGVVIVLSH